VTTKATVDTNVLISGIFWTGVPFEILKAWQDGRFQLAISPPILEEYRRVLEFLETAVAAGADYVVTGDVALLPVKQYQRVQIVRPKQFLKALFG